MKQGVSALITAPISKKEAREAILSGIPRKDVGWYGSFLWKLDGFAGSSHMLETGKYVGHRHVQDAAHRRANTQVRRRQHREKGGPDRELGFK